MHHVVVRHGKHDLSPRCGPCEFLFVLFVIRILCDSMIISSRPSFEHEESSLFVSILDHSLAQGRTQLEPFGSARMW